MNRLKFFIPVIIFFGVGIFLFLGLELDPSAMPSALIDKNVPSFSLPELLDESRVVTEKDLLGKVALVNVWATWCVSCRVEHQYLNQISRDYKIAIYGVNYKDDSKSAREWLQKYQNPYAFNIVDAKGTLGLDLGVYGAPETYVIDKTGVIRHKRVGVIDMRVWNEELKPLIDQLQK